MYIDTNGLALGDTVRDATWNVEGVVIGFTQWQTGCARATIVRGYDKDGKQLDSHGQDVLLLELIKAGPNHGIDTTKGGPMVEPPNQR